VLRPAQEDHRAGRDAEACYNRIEMVLLDRSGDRVTRRRGTAGRVPQDHGLDVRVRVDQRSKLRRILGNDASRQDELIAGDGHRHRVRRRSAREQGNSERDRGDEASGGSGCRESSNARHRLR